VTIMDRVTALLAEIDEVTAECMGCPGDIPTDGPSDVFCSEACQGRALASMGNPLPADSGWTTAWAVDPGEATLVATLRDDEGSQIGRVAPVTGDGSVADLRAAIEATSISSVSIANGDPARIRVPVAEHRIGRAMYVQFDLPDGTIRFEPRLPHE